MRIEFSRLIEDSIFIYVCVLFENIDMIKFTYSHIMSNVESNITKNTLCKTYENVKFIINSPKDYRSDLSNTYKVIFLISNSTIKNRVNTYEVLHDVAQHYGLVLLKLKSTCDQFILITMLIQGEYDMALRFLGYKKYKVKVYIPILRRHYLKYGTPEMVKYTDMRINSSDIASLIYFGKVELLREFINKKCVTYDYGPSIHYDHKFKEFINNGGEDVIMNKFGEEFIGYFNDNICNGIMKFGGEKIQKWFIRRKDLAGIKLPRSPMFCVD